jgi:hypothetical protein
MNSNAVKAWVVVLVAAFAIACGGGAPTPPPPSSPTTTQPADTKEAETAREALQALAERARGAKEHLTFEEFKATVYKEKFAGGKYIVNGDTPIRDDKQLLDFYERRVKAPSPERLIVDQVDGMDNVWGAQEKRQIKYCVSRLFGTRYDRVVQEMNAAAGEWEKSAAVDFVHDPAQDGSCSPSNAAVIFDVRPVDEGAYLARAFFPMDPRAARNVLVDESALTLPAGDLQLGGVLRHELGHTLGFRHEHTRPDSGKCFEDAEWEPLTKYDAFSVMHYPQCNGKAGWTLKLTDKDRHGAACVYGAATGFTLDGQHVVISKCAKEVAGGQPQTQTFGPEIVAKGGEKTYGSFRVRAGSTFSAKIGGPGASGDPDLYVRFGSAPSRATRQWDCRPFLSGATEACSLTAPSSDTDAHVMVHGYAAGKYGVDVSHVPPTP